MKTIPLSQGKVATVDDADFEWLSQWKWCAQLDPIRGKWYAVRTFWTSTKSYGVKMHRLILGLNRGDKTKTDHINGNGLDNQRGNLRRSTSSTNAMNRGRTVKNRSGFKGVFRWRNGWRATIGAKGKDIYLGDFSTAEAAHAAYCEAAKKYHGEFARFE